MELKEMWCWGKKNEVAGFFCELFSPLLPVLSFDILFKTGLPSPIPTNPGNSYDGLQFLSLCLMLQYLMKQC